MKKTQLIFAGIAECLLFSNALFSQEKPKEWDVSLYGFARADYIFDLETVCTGERIPSQPLSFRQKIRCKW